MHPRTHTALSPTPLDVTDAHAFCENPGAGAVVVFTGTARDTTDGRAVEALTYEAWDERARAGLAGLAQQIASRWPAVLAVFIEHRTGRLRIGEPAVVVGVASPHRPEAFAAAAWCLEELKAEVPIWKQEHWADGEAHWPGTN